MPFHFEITENITDDGTRVRQLGHVTTTSPAKYGERDIKVQWITNEDSGIITPSVVEELWATGNMTLAQYNVFKEPARSALSIGNYLMEIASCRSEREVDLVCEKAALNWALHRAWLR